MSKANIIQIIPSRDGVYVVFQARSRQRTYRYEGAAAAAVLAGADPAGLDGEEVNGVEAAGAAVEGVADILEIL